MYEVSNHDHLAAKVDALTQKFEKLNVSAVTPTPAYPPCEICGNFGHIGVDCQLGSAANGVQQMNYAQYNMGTSQTKTFIKTLKVPMDKGSKLEETVAKAKSTKGENIKLPGENDVIESEKPLDKTKAPPPLRLAKLNLEARFNKFVNILKKISIKISFAEALSWMPLYAKFLKEIFSKKETIEHNETITLTRECSAIIKKPPPKLRDPGSFAIPCVIGSETIDRPMCDLGASVSLLPLPLFKRMRIRELKKPTKMTLKLAERSTIQPVGFIEDIPVKIEGIYIPTDFMVVDIEEDHDVPIILGRPFLATAGAIVDVKNGRIIFHVRNVMVGFELENVMKGPAFYSCCMYKDHDVKERFLASSTQYDLFDPF
ncbi:uncharacterized protein [Medicago truncatula]|uniref:uncharacterized protein n=1 Tax=Medicago truncatula TaxID=3880 RepID=UPI0019678FE6|nr:uncharacterized protein LOC112422089 [Medicago truncatula]